MRKHNIDIDDDFIGGQGSLTKIEEQALSDFFRQKKQSNKAIIKAITWFSAMEEAKMPIDTKPAPKNKSPMQEPHIPPVSIFPFGAPKT